MFAMYSSLPMSIILKTLQKKNRKRETLRKPDENASFYL